MRRAAAIALAALAAVPAAAGAQFRARPMVIPVPYVGTTVLTEAFSTAPGAGEPDLADLLLIRSLAFPSLRTHHALLSPLASPVQQPLLFRWVAAGRLAENAEDALPDVAYSAGALNELQIAYGDAPTTLRSYTHAQNTSQTPTLTFARLLPAPRRSDVIVLPASTGRGLSYEGDLYAVDVGTAAGAPAMVDRVWPARSITKRTVLPDEVLTLRISPTARDLGIDDLYLPGFGSVTLFAHASAPAGTALAAIDFGPGALKLGGAAGEGLDPSTWLPAGIANNDVLGAAALDVDGDGDLDLVLSLAPAAASASSPPGKLLWIERTGDVASLAASRPWRDLTSHPDLQPLVNPTVLRALELGGAPALAVFDRGTDSVLVVTAGATPGRLTVWRGGAAGREIRDLRLADLVGSPSPDLVADATQPLSSGAPGPAVLVWPDVGDASPELAWAPGSPGEASRGADLPLAVAAGDPDGAFEVEWMIGDPYGAPASETQLPGGAVADVTWLVSGPLLCGTPPQTLAVTVRATDGFGVFDELSAALGVGAGPPALAVAGAVPPDRLALPPGGTSATLEGSAWPGCGAIAFTWGGSVLGAAASVTVDDAGTTTRRILDLPESSYPALLASAPAATLVASEPSTGWQSPAATLALDLDARGLVELDHAADLVSLEPGETTVIRTRLRSRLGVPLAEVHVVDVLSGLAPAGEPRATGARIVSTSSGGGELVLDVLPPAGAEVTVELPVRSLGDRGASVVEARSSAGHLLTPAASAPASDATAPGCGCGGGGAGLEALLALAALAARSGRRAPPRARAT